MKVFCYFNMDYSRVIKSGITNLSLDDLGLLTFLVHWGNTKMVKKVTVNGKEYFWASHKYIITQLSFLGYKNPNSVRYPIDKLISLGLLEKCPNNEILGMSFYRTTEKSDYIVLGLDNESKEIADDLGMENTENLPQESNDTPSQNYEGTPHEIMNPPSQNYEESIKRISIEKKNISTAAGGKEKTPNRKKVNKDYSSTNDILELFNYYFDTTYVNTQSFHESMLYIKQNYDMETIKDTLKAVSKVFNNDQSNPFYTFFPGVFQKHAMKKTKNAGGW